MLSQGEIGFSHPIKAFVASVAALASYKMSEPVYYSMSEDVNKADCNSRRGRGRRRPALMDNQRCRSAAAGIDTIVFTLREFTVEFLQAPDRGRAQCSPPAFNSCALPSG